MKNSWWLGVAGALLFGMAPGSIGQVPQALTVQGTVLAQGLPFSGTGQFKFALVSPDGAQTFWSNDGSSVGGSEPRQAVAWEVADGSYAIALGDSGLAGMAVLPATVFTNAAVHLRTWFSDGAQGFQRLLPDEPILPVGYAQMAARVAPGSVEGSQLAPGAITADKLAPGAVGPDQLAGGAALGNLRDSGVLPFAATADDARLLEAGYQSIGSMEVEGERWGQWEFNAPPARTGHQAFWAGNAMIVLGGKAAAGSPANPLLPGFAFNPRTGGWSEISPTNAPRVVSASASDNSADWRTGLTGMEVLVWNSRTRVGRRLNPWSLTWTSMSVTGAPSPRLGPFTVWTGREWFVWGGSSPTGSGETLGNGARYDPVDDLWRPVTTNGAPRSRQGNLAVWTGQKVILGGGGALSGGNTVALNDTWAYDPALDSWERIHAGSGVNLSGTWAPTLIWTGKELLLPGATLATGGSSFFGALRLDLATRQWQAIRASGGPPSILREATCIWTGSEMVIWGGVIAEGVTSRVSQRGFAYDPVGNAWRELSQVDAPTPRRGHSAVWTGREVLVWGGNAQWAGSVELDDGGRYDPVQDRWLPMGQGIPARTYPTLAWTGTELLVWGGWPVGVVRGSSLGQVLMSGRRFNPAIGRWRPISGLHAPSPRYGYSAVWTGREWIIWGGFSADRNKPEPLQGLANGARYDPAADRWISLSTDGAPSPRGLHSAVWTGREMIIWGGTDRYGGINRFNTGGRWDAATGEWRPTSTVLGRGTLTGRSDHSAVWSGTAMLIWGRSTEAGLRYDPASDRWSKLGSSGAPITSEGLPAFAIWTPSGLLAWGDRWGLYDPELDIWRSVSRLNSTSWGADALAAWTGREVVLWGGALRSAHRFDPSANQWRRLTGVGAPAARAGASGVWTGDRLLVVGGTPVAVQRESVTQTMPVYSTRRAIYLYGPKAEP